MKKIGNILTTKTFPDAEAYNVVDEIGKCDASLPTLIVGKDVAKELAPNFDILDKELEEDVFWTYGNREKRSVYEERVKFFKKYTIDKIKNEIHYIPINIITDNEEDKRKLFNMMEHENIVVFIANDMLYANKRGEKDVYGLSLRDINYIGKDSTKFLAKLHSHYNVTFVDGTTDVPQSIKYEFRNCLYVIPYLCS